MSSFISLAAALDGVANRLGLSAKLAEQRLVRAWPQIVGEQIAAHTRPESIRFKKLYLIARNSIWLQQLSFLKPELITKVNAASGQELITDIALRVGEVGEPHVEAQAEELKERPASPPSPELLAEAADHVEGIGDEELRRQFTDVMARALAPRGSSSHRRSVP